VNHPSVGSGHNQDKSRQQQTQQTFHTSVAPAIH
jgi:hypothetical protein